MQSMLSKVPVSTLKKAKAGSNQSPESNDELSRALFQGNKIGIPSRILLSSPRAVMAFPILSSPGLISLLHKILQQ